MGVTRPGHPGSGYAVGGRLVLTSAHVVARAGERVEVFRPADDGVFTGMVVWCGTPGGRDDAALVRVDAPQWQAPAGAVRWGRLVTDQPGTDCETWGVPDVAQRSVARVETAQLKGRVNPGSGFVGNQYVMDLVQHPPQWSLPDTSPWGGLSGAAMFGGRLLTGVVASDRAHSAHGQLNVVPAYVLHHDPAFRAVLAEHGGGVRGLEAVELQRLADPASTAPRGEPRSPAALLEAGRQTVPFHGREDLLKQLRAWCAQGGFGAWLLHGPGGQGKTRLAHHLAALLAADNWAVLLPRPDASAAELREVRHAAKPLLVVVDYAETRTGQLSTLIEAAAEHPGTTPLKILLLARTDGDWWARAKTATSLAQDYLDMAPSQRLPPLEDDPADRPQAYRAAASALATVLPHVTGSAAHDWRAAVATLQAPRLDQDGYGNALTLHMTALADLLDTVAPADPSGPARGGARWQGAEGVEDRLLGHEGRYWHQTATTRGLAPGLSLDTLERALAASHLAGASDREQADRTWRRLPALADQARDRRDAVTGWIGALYPPTDPGRPWGSLQPDRLAERHIGRVLSADPTLADHLLQNADAAQAAQLLTVYSRAAAHPVFNGSLDTQLTGLCVRRHQQLASQVITTATQTDHPAPLITALERITTDRATSLSDLSNLQNRLPESSRRLADVATRLAKNLTDRYRVLAEAHPDVYLPNLAVALNNLSGQLGEVGRGEEGLAAIEEAVDHHRALAETNPDVYLPNLAVALNNLSVQLGEVGRGEEGLAVVLEAVGHFRVLAETNPDAYLPDLAMALNNLAVRLREVRRGEECLAAVLEAVGYFRVLAEAHPDAHLPNFAMALNNLAIRLGEVGRGEEGLAAIEEAVGHYRALAETNPDAHLPILATALNNLSGQLGEAGRREEGLATVLEAVGHYRVLAKAHPDAYLPNLAVALNNLANRLGEVGRGKEGLAAVLEAVGYFRVLAEAHPDAHLPNFAMALNNLANRLREAGRREECLAAIEEAVGHYRALAETNPDAHLPNLATALNNLAVQLSEAGRGKECLAAIEEAVGHYRVLAKAHPDTHLPDLAVALNNLANRLGEVGRGEEGFAVIEEAVGHFRVLAETNPDAHLPDLAGALNNLAVRLGRLGRGEEGLAAIEEAVGHYRVLAETNPDAYLPNLAMVLDHLAVHLREVGRGEAGLAAIEEAAHIRRALGEHIPHNEDGAVLHDPPDRI
ncbi:serine protease [Streptomyces sp. ISL-43]|uniref:tetratricopeptide repeat-containing S1 family peptidase n=1 Tax=Streptomyces sp. ISL-43 TaxID=2819183 RepID=UPI001BEB9A4C|nr:tetratricopeptide repeat-containing serine protease family protein [Streptomyces sp. ISL-43]MBT2452394.1 serine protease [Streptomyces sp. ISL-43]